MSASHQQTPMTSHVKPWPAAQVNDASATTLPDNEGRLYCIRKKCHASHFPLLFPQLFPLPVKYVCIFVWKFWLFEQKTSDRRAKSSPARGLTPKSRHGGASTSRSAAELVRGLEDPETIRFYPLTSWTKNVPCSGDLVSELAERRRRYGWRVDFHDFKLPFLQNVAEKLAQTPVE